MVVYTTKWKKINKPGFPVCTYHKCRFQQVEILGTQANAPFPTSEKTMRSWLLVAWQVLNPEVKLESSKIILIDRFQSRGQ